jgi:hypothetical protein
MRLMMGTSLRATSSEFDTARAFGTSSSKNRVKAVRPAVGGVREREMISTNDGGWVDAWIHLITAEYAYK